MKRTKITRVAVDRLRLNEGQLPWLPKNPRSWTQTDIDRMVKSIDEDPDFAEVRPVLAVPGEGKELIVFAHNLLTKAAMVRGDKTLPVAVFEPETEEDQETIRRLALKDNGSFGSWDTDILANEWNAEPWQLEDWGVPEWITGGAGKETGSGAGTSGAEGSAKSAKEDEDFDPNAGILVRCKPGDVWQLGDHRLMCGDSLQEETFEKLMAGELADMVFTDPPYGTTALKWDIKIDLEKMFHIVRGVCKKDACILITGAQPFVTDIINAGRDFFRHEIIWKKTQATGFLQANHAPLKIHENILVFGKTGGTYNPQKKVIGEATGRVRKQSADRAAHYHGNNESTYIDDGTRFPTDVIEFSNWNGALFGNTENAVVHPTQKPVDLVAYLLKTYSNEGELVIDSFLGSGTTIIAAEQTKRKCYGVELDPHYCDVILSRWEQLTGRKAEKLN